MRRYPMANLSLEKELYKACNGLLKIAELAMPDTYFQSDSRVNRARKAIKRYKRENYRPTGLTEEELEEKKND
jgi:hypothetical protein